MRTANCISSHTENWGYHLYNIRLYDNPLVRRITFLRTLFSGSNFSSHISKLQNYFFSKCQKIFSFTLHTMGRYFKGRNFRVFAVTHEKCQKLKKLFVKVYSFKNFKFVSFVQSYSVNSFKFFF